MNNRVPLPFLLNCWKHHFLFLVGEIQLIKEQSNLDNLKKCIKNFGNSTTDLYIGDMDAKEISDYCVSMISNEIALNRDSYSKWIGYSPAFKTITLPDNSIWILRNGKRNKRFVHIHPGRKVPHTIRVKANVLKTSFFVHAYSFLFSKDPYNIDIINQVRKDILDLSPIKSASYEHEFGRVLKLFGKYLVHK